MPVNYLLLEFTSQGLAAKDKSERKRKTYHDEGQTGEVMVGHSFHPPHVSTNLKLWRCYENIMVMNNCFARIRGCWMEVMLGLDLRICARQAI